MKWALIIDVYDEDKVFCNKATKSFNLSNNKFFELVLIDYNAITFADHY